MRMVEGEATAFALAALVPLNGEQFRVAKAHDGMLPAQQGACLVSAS